MLRCRDGSLYTGWTNHLAERVAAHQAGRGAKYTKSREPVELCYYEVFHTKEEAMRREYAIKQMSRSEKLALTERKNGSRFLHGMKGVIFDFDGTIFYDEGIQGKKEAYSRECCLKSPDFHLAPEFPAFLDRLREEKIPFTIATASGKNKVRFFFEHLELERWFDPEQVVYNDGTLPEKPELYLKAAKRLAVSPEECMIFEDSVSGLESARQAGSSQITGISFMKPAEALRKAEEDEIIRCEHLPD